MIDPQARRAAVASGSGAFGVTSMTAPLRRVLVRRPATSGDWEGAGWRVPDADALARQHEAFCALLAELGAEVEVAAALDGQVDAVYMHDPLLLTAAGGLPLRMRKPARAREPAHARERARAPRRAGPRRAARGRVRRRRRPLLGRRRPDGDRPRLPNQPGRRGRLWRSSTGVAVETYDLPHDHGPAHVLHLQSFISAVTDELCVIYEPLAPVAAAAGPARARAALDRDRSRQLRGDGLQHPRRPPGRRRDGRRRAGRAARARASRASRSTSTTAPSCRSRATAGRPA